MKTPQPGDIVTPKESTRRYTYGQHYKVTRSDNEVFYIIDDWGIEKQCYIEDWTLIKRVSIFERICNLVNKILCK